MKVFFFQMVTFKVTMYRLCFKVPDCFLLICFAFNFSDHVMRCFYLMIGRHLILFFPETVYILHCDCRSRDDLLYDLTFGRHLIPLFPKNNLL